MMRGVLALAIVAALSACDVAGGPGHTDAANGREIVASISPQPSAAQSTQPAHPRPVWIDSLQMISAATGWALISTSNPTSSSALQVARTSDGGRTWHITSPAAMRVELSEGSTLLSIASAQRAWVVGTIGRSSVVFGTSDGGRSWWRSKAIAGDDPVAVDFAGQGHGWLLESMGAAMSQNPVRLYRSSNGGRSWSLAAQTAQAPGERPNASGLPVACDKTGVGASPVNGGNDWITGFCPASLTDAVLVSRDGGAHWGRPQLPIPSSLCQQSGCEAVGPQFAGRTTFLVLWAYPDQALLLSTTDGGASWRISILPAGAGPYPRVKFFGPADGIAVSAGPQGSIGRTFYATTNGGRTWSPVAQGRRFSAGRTSFDFLSPALGFAWATAAAPVIYQTSTSGRSWTPVAPSLG